MIISSDLESAFSSIKPSLVALQQVVDEMLRSLAVKCGGQFESSRIKPLESITAKIEKDAIKKPFKEIDDLLAATVVFTTRKQMEVFEEQIIQFCEIVDRKTERGTDPEKFYYDDRHLILRLLPEYHAVLDKPTIRGFLFEVQLKTHLQFAVSKWSRVSYKPKIFSWSLVRLISQTRALVEMAETALSRIEESGVEPNEVVGFVQYERRNKIISLLRSKLMPEQLPDDMRRLAVTVEPYLNMFFNYDKQDEKQQIETMGALGKLLDKNIDLVSATSLTAYNVIFIVLFREYKDSMCRIQGDKLMLTKGRKVILITKEMLEFCPELAQLTPECRTDLEMQ